MDIAYPRDLFEEAEKAGETLTCIASVFFKVTEVANPLTAVKARKLIFVSFQLLEIIGG